VFNSLAAGTYTITAKDNTGATTGTTVVTVAVSTPSFATVATTNATTTSCIGTISVTGAGSNSPYTYSINGATAASSGNFTALCAGTYTVCVSNAIGCSACTTATVIAANPLAFIVPINTTQPCFNTTNGSLSAPATGGIAPLEYTIGGTYASTSTFNSLAPGIYTVTVKDFTSATLSTTVNLTLSSNLLFAASQSAGISCNNSCSGEVTGNFLNGVTPYSYTLNGGVASGSNIFGSLCAGVYTLQATDASGCSKISVVTLVEPAPLSSNLQISQIRCTNDNDGSISATGIGGVGSYQYSIDGGLYSALNTFGSLTPATYTIAVQDANSCSVSTVVTITQSTTLLSITGTSTPTTGSNNGSITGVASNGTAPYKYSLNGGTPTTNNVFSALANGNYTLTVTDAAGCAKSVVLSITFAEGLTTTNFEGSINIYPNPAKDVINIDAETKGSNAVQIQIIDVLGQVIYKNYALSTNGSVSTSIDVSSFASGHYQVMLMDDLRRVAVKQVTIK
jgi:large repetitive protein